MSQDNGAMPLKNAKQEQFCQEYLIDLDATAAARRAGYSDPNYGRQIITHPNASLRIAFLMQGREQRTQITQDRVLNELALIAFSNLDDFATWGGDVNGDNLLTLKPSKDLTRAQKSVIKSIKHTRKRGKAHEDTLEIVREDKLSALDKLAKHLNLYGEHGDDGKRSGLDRMIEYLAERREKREGEE